MLFQEDIFKAVEYLANKQKRQSKLFTSIVKKNDQITRRSQYAGMQARAGGEDLSPTDSPRFFPYLICRQTEASRILVLAENN
jgi:hypothetical protein